MESSDNYSNALKNLMKVYDKSGFNPNNNQNIMVSDINNNLAAYVLELEKKIEKMNDILVKALIVIRESDKKTKQIRDKNSSLAAKISEIKINQYGIEDIKTIVLRQMEALDVSPFTQTTKIRTKNSQTITAPLRYLDRKGKGVIEQILLESQSDNFGIFIMVDGNVFFDEQWSYFYSSSDYLDKISAFENGGIYLLSLREIHYKKSFQIDINTTSSTTFNKILVKYIIREEVPR